MQDSENDVDELDPDERDDDAAEAIDEEIAAEVLVDRILAVVVTLVRQVSLGVGMIRNQEKLGCREVLMVAAEDLNRGYHLAVLEQSEV